MVAGSLEDCCLLSLKLEGSGSRTVRRSSVAGSGCCLGLMRSGTGLPIARRV